MKLQLFVIVFLLSWMSSCSEGSGGNKRSPGIPEETTTFEGSVSRVLHGLLFPVAHAQTAAERAVPRCYSNCETSNCAILQYYNYLQKTFVALCTTNLVDADNDPTTPPTYKFQVSKADVEGYLFRVSTYSGRARIFEGLREGLKNLEMNVNSTLSAILISKDIQTLANEPKVGFLEEVNQKFNASETTDTLAKIFGFDPKEDSWKKLLIENFSEIDSFVNNYRDQISKAILEKDLPKARAEFLALAKAPYASRLLRRIYETRDLDNDSVNDLADCAPSDEGRFAIREHYPDPDGDGCGTDEKISACVGKAPPPGHSYQSDYNCQRTFPVFQINLYSFYRNDTYHSIWQNNLSFYINDVLSLKNDTLSVYKANSVESPAPSVRYALESDGKIIRVLKDWSASYDLSFSFTANEMKQDLWLVVAVKNGDTYNPAGAWGDAVKRYKLFTTDNRCPVGSSFELFDPQIGTSMCSWRNLLAQEYVQDPAYKDKVYFKFTGMPKIPNLYTSTSITTNFQFPYATSGSSSSESTSSESTTPEDSTLVDESNLTQITCSLNPHSYVFVNTDLSQFVFRMKDYLSPADFTLVMANAHNNGFYLTLENVKDPSQQLTFSCHSVPGSRITAAWLREIFTKANAGIQIFTGKAISREERSLIEARSNLELCAASKYPGDVADERYRYKLEGIVAGDGCAHQKQRSYYSASCVVGNFDGSEEYNLQYCVYPPGQACTSPEGDHGQRNYQYRYSLENAPKPDKCAQYGVTISDRCIDGTWVRESGSVENSFAICRDPVYANCVFKYSERYYSWGGTYEVTLNIGHQSYENYSRGQNKWCGSIGSYPIYGWDRYKASCFDGQVTTTYLGCY